MAAAEVWTPGQHRHTLASLALMVSLTATASSVGCVGRDPVGLPQAGVLSGLSEAAGAMHTVGLSVREEVYLRLEPLNRCRSHVIEHLRSAHRLRPDFLGGRKRALELAARSQAEITEGLREALLPAQSGVEGVLIKRLELKEGNAAAPQDLWSAFGRRVRLMRTRFDSSVDGMRELMESAASNHETKAEEIAERLLHLLERNQRELRSHLDRANLLLASWAAQVSMEERKLEEKLNELREQQRALLSEVKTSAEHIALEAQVEAIRQDWAQRQDALRDTLRQRQQTIATKIREVSRDSKVLARLYDDLAIKKQSALDTSAANDETFQRAIDLILEDSTEGGWEQVVSAQGGALVVQRKFMGRDSKGSKFACIRAWCTMNVSAEAIAELFKSSDRVKEYNKWFADGRDLALLDDDTKVEWASSPPVLRFVKPRDFVTVVHVRRLQDGSIVVVNRGVQHPDAPPHDDYVRGEVILAANIIRPDARRPNRTHFSMLTQVDPGGIAPAWIINKISSRDPVDFMQRVESAARTSDMGAKR